MYATYHHSNHVRTDGTAPTHIGGGAKSGADYETLGYSQGQQAPATKYSFIAHGWSLGCMGAFGFWRNIVTAKVRLQGVVILADGTHASKGDLASARWYPLFDWGLSGEGLVIVGTSEIDPPTFESSRAVTGHYLRGRTPSGTKVGDRWTASRYGGALFHLHHKGGGADTHMWFVGPFALTIPQLFM